MNAKRPSSFNPYAGGRPLGPISPLSPSRRPDVIEREEIVALPFVEVPPRGEAFTKWILQEHFKAKRFCIYADDATKLRVELQFGHNVGGTGLGMAMPAAIFSDGPAVDRTPFVLHCSECGAPTKEAAPKCSYCGAPFTWRLTETAYGQSGLALDFPPLGPGMYLEAKFTNRSDKSIGVDAAFIGLVAREEWR
jgi:hypothetical protein